MGSFQQGLRSWLLGAVLFTLTSSAGVYLASCGDDSSKRKPADASVNNTCVPTSTQEYACANLPQCETANDGCDVFQCPCIDPSQVCSSATTCVTCTKDSCDCTAKTPAEACGNRQCGTAALGCNKGLATCGSNGGGCPDGKNCVNGQCTGGGGGTCEPNCAGKCGGDPDGCNTGGTCPNPCSGSQTCSGGVCSNPPPDPCAGKECGTFGGKACGSMNGNCPAEKNCQNGTCIANSSCSMLCGNGVCCTNGHCGSADSEGPAAGGGNTCCAHHWCGTAGNLKCCGKAGSCVNDACPP